MHDVWLDNPAPAAGGPPSVTWFRMVPGDLVEALHTITRTFLGIDTHGPGNAHGKLPPTRVASTSPGLAALLAEHYTYGENERRGGDGQPLPANACTTVTQEELHSEYRALHRDPAPEMDTRPVEETPPPETPLQEIQTQ